MSEENKEDYENKSICRFCEKKLLNLLKLEIIVIRLENTDE